MGTYLQSVWQCRRFWLNLVYNDLQLRYRRSVLGIGWSLLFPLFTSLVMAAVFHEIFRVPIREFLPLLLSGLAFWAYITGATIEGCQSYVAAESYIRQHSLPLAVYPLRTTLGQFIHFVIALGLVFLMVCILRPPENFFGLIFLIPGLLILLVFGWSVAVLFAFLNTIFRDTQHILQLGFQVLFYLTPIIYPDRTLLDTRFGWILKFNPLLYYLELVRSPLLAGKSPPLECYGLTGLGCLLLGMAALCSLQHQQRRVILYL